VFLFSYDIEDLKYKRQFVVNLQLSICLESNGPCLMTIPILDNAILSKSVCKWKSNFIDPGIKFQTLYSIHQLLSWWQSVTG